MRWAGWIPVLVIAAACGGKLAEDDSVVLREDDDARGAQVPPGRTTAPVPLGPHPPATTTPSRPPTATATATATSPPPPCRPSTCAELGAECGVLDVGCGVVRDCGRCPATACGNTCGLVTANRCSERPGCQPPPCRPRTCAEVGANCGSIDDRCGSSVYCGQCPAPLSCGGAGSNRCGLDRDGG